MMLATGTTVQLKTAAQLVKERRIDFRRAQKASNAGMSVTKAGASTASAKASKATAGAIVAVDDIHALVRWAQPRKIGPGLMNLGNTCYLNSVLQCLVYSPAFAQYLIPRATNQPATKHITPHAGGSPFHAEKAMARFLSLMHSPTAPRVMQPRDIVVNLKQIAKGFRIGRQEDSHEFFRHLMDALHKASLRQAGLTDKSPLANSTLVHSVFGGTLRSHVQCAKCKYVSERVEPFLDLSLEVSSGISSISAALAHFTAVETLDAANAWKCSGCSQRSKASKGLNVHDIPNALVLHLKRFDAFHGKLKKHIEFSETLNLNNGGAKGGRILSKPHEYATYALTAVLVHAGSSPDCGHYYAFVKSPAGTWHEMNDETVRVVNIHTVLQQRAYMLFYSRQLPPPVVKSKPPVAPVKANMSEFPAKLTTSPAVPTASDDGETSQESMSGDDENYSLQHRKVARASVAESSSPVKGIQKEKGPVHFLQKPTRSAYGPVFLGRLWRHHRFHAAAWKRHGVPHSSGEVFPAAVEKSENGGAEASTDPSRRPVEQHVVIKAGFRPHAKFQNSLLSADVPQWRDDDEDVSADLQIQHNQKVRQLNAELWQAKRSKQLDFWDQTLDQGKLKKVKKRKEFVSNEGKANQFQRVLDAKKPKRV
ncbi:hypothetical protein H310_13752 [Aphanomyces invadans]|uniref:Ubiquitin carboxyl-terminal hydrolase n=1 Tax=Aphanomyces invadans TaxID=157072 RepID=A0A024TBY7_9STRA|nr:hypothetical protein H310_13752 [Aphanomyces invadans]ETV91675.1 hypothetical protein H310_13752 [Aphanomyces invadans]|eukprot:XP_008879601.1 hypothetical protein H310_13752 [Aphanomyces invadans]